ncbi:MAG TPA: hypothetical protein VLJ76_11630 [Gaiellaceae bacterium]|nr:hypothetical protein [Gaiellaceae bacterium]
MPVVTCRQCEGSVEEAFRFCPWCAAPLRSKLVEFFRPHPLVESGAGRALRVSSYLGPSAEERHVRFSVWNEEGRAEAAVSLDEGEALRLARFVAGSISPREARQKLVDRLLSAARR